MVKSKYEMTEAEFAAKIDSEGGVFAALEYGLTPQHCEPGPLKDLWTELHNEYQKMWPTMGNIYGHLDKLEYDSE